MALRALVFAVVVLLAPVAAAGERLVGAGHALEVPDPFVAQVVRPGRGEARFGGPLVRGLPGAARVACCRVFLAGPASRPEGMIEVCRLRSASAAAGETALRLGLTALAAALPAGRLVDLARAETAAGVSYHHAVLAHVGPDGAARRAHAALFLNENGHTALLVTVDGPASMPIDYEAYFSAVVSSVRFVSPAPDLAARLRTPGLAAAGLLFVWLLVRTLRSRRQRAVGVGRAPRLRIREVTAPELVGAGATPPVPSPTGAPLAALPATPAPDADAAPGKAFRIQRNADFLADDGGGAS
jgi:hypothetical protein